MNITDLAAELSRGMSRPPDGRGWPTCQHRSPGDTLAWADRVPCDRPAEFECNTGNMPGRARYVCGRHAQYQKEILGPLALSDDSEVRLDHEGGFATASRPADVRVIVGRVAAQDRESVLRNIARIAEETGLRVVMVADGAD